VSKETIAKKKEKETFQKPVAKSASQRSLTLKASVSRKAPEARVEEARDHQEARFGEAPADYKQQNTQPTEPEVLSHQYDSRSTSPELSRIPHHVRETTLEQAVAHPLPPSPPPPADSPAVGEATPLKNSDDQEQKHEEESTVPEAAIESRAVSLNAIAEPQACTIVDEVAHETPCAVDLEPELLEEQTVDEIQGHDTSVLAQDDSTPEQVQDVAIPIISETFDERYDDRLALLSERGLDILYATCRHTEHDAIRSDYSQCVARSTTPTEVPPKSTEAELLRDLEDDGGEPEADATLLLADSANAAIGELPSKSSTAAVDTPLLETHLSPQLLDQSAASLSAFSGTDAEGDLALMLEEQPSQRAWDDDSVADRSQSETSSHLFDDDQTSVLPQAVQSTDNRANSAGNITERPNPPVQEEAEEREEQVEEKEEEEEDDVALLISRELSDDSLEELASRFEHSLVGHVDDDHTSLPTMDDATPMRIRSTQFLPESWLNNVDEKDRPGDDEDATQILTMSIKAPRTLQSRKEKLTTAGVETPTRIRSPLGVGDVNKM
jgi:hypothetical protein